MNTSRSVPLLLAVVLLASSALSRADHHLQAVEFTSQKLSDSVYLLQGKGGNLALSVGADGLFLIDNDLAEIRAATRKAIAAISPEPVKFVVNTHWHSDHVGANALLGEEGAIIVAHDKVRARLLKGGRIAALDANIPPAAPAALPVVTFADSLTFHWNGDTVRVEHPVASGHTDGDGVIFFEEDNILHSGDLFFNGLYPFIDVSSGGSLSGTLAGVERLLERCDAQTRIIPGHGPLGNKQALQRYRDMLVVVKQRIETLKAEGKSREQIIAAKPTADLDAQWGNGFLKPDQWVGIAVDAL